jgi:hypothetical protein
VVVEGQTILGRLVAAKIGEWQWVRLDGKIITDPDHPGTGRLLISPPPVTEAT